MKAETVIAANRFGLGARPGDLDAIDNAPEDWLVRQVAGDYDLPGPIRALPSSASVLVDVQAIRRRGRDGDPVEKIGRVLRRHFVDQVEARYATAASTDEPFRERLVHFFSNHFAVSADKPPLPALAGLYENEAIRPHVTGRFADLLLAVEQHPAMILYLDNQRSIGPASTLGRRANRRGRERSIGLNENLAREILELHTLGVDGGYSQRDVQSLARVITGWSVGGGDDRGRFSEGTPGEFAFREAIHEPGTKTMLGQSYADNGVGQGEAVLRDLAMHPATARHVSTKLTRHFVADDPPAEIVDRLTDTWLKSDGDLARVCTALVESALDWRPRAPKYKSPHDVFVSTTRALEAPPGDGRRVVAVLETLGQVPWRPGSPAGWPDSSAQWGGADALYKRIEFADTVANLTNGRVDPVELGRAVLGPAMSHDTELAVARAESRSQGMTLLLASPDFQRR
ncbi:MAG: DUF1800 domain-containing protein [Pseudomonadota bacterium]